MSDITKAQRSLAIKAEHNKQHRFDHLYRLICLEEWIDYCIAYSEVRQIDPLIM